MRISKKLKRLLVIYVAVYLMIGLTCFMVDFQIWKDTGSFPPSGTGSPSFPIAYFSVLCCFLPLSFLVKNTAKAESKKKIEAVMKCLILIIIIWLLIAPIALLASQ